MQGQGSDPFYYQRGQALFLVLIAIALFAALAYVVTQATPGGHAASGLRTVARVAAYPAAVQSAVKKMLAADVSVSELDFSTDAEGKAAVFSPSFGLAYRSPEPALGAGIEWNFKGISPEGRGFFVSGIGTDGPKGKDAIAYIDNVPLKACEEINEALGLLGKPLPEVPSVNLDGKGGGAKDSAGKNPYTFHAYSAAPKQGACVQNGDKYVYYHVIVAQ
jgi:hypothetical protein